MKTFPVISFALVSGLAAISYGEEHIDNRFLCQFPLQLRAVYKIEKQETEGGISRDKISILEENHKKILDRSFQENSFEIKPEGKSCSVFKGKLRLFSGFHHLRSFMCNSEVACFLGARSEKPPFGIHRVDRGAAITDYEQLKLYVHHAGNTQEISFPRNFYPSRLFLSSKGRNLFIKGTIIETTKEGTLSKIIADHAFLFYDIALRRLYPVWMYSSADSAVSARVLDLSTDRIAFILLDSANGIGHTQVVLEIVIDPANYFRPAVTEL